MLLALIILWLVVVVATSVWVGLRGRRLAVSARAAQAEVDRCMEASQLDLLPAKLEELQRRQHVLRRRWRGSRSRSPSSWCCTARWTPCAAS